MRKSPAEAAAAAVKKLLDRREHLLKELAKVNSDLSGIGAQVGTKTNEPNMTATEVLAHLAPPKPAMAGEHQPASTEPKRSMGELMAEALKNPDQFKSGPRAPFIPPEERDGAPEKSLTTEGISPADSMGAGRYI